MGNTYSGSSPTGLSATFDISKPGDIILIVSFGSGAGSDAFIFEITKRIEDVRNLAPKVREMLDEKKIYLDYGKYAKFREKIILNEFQLQLTLEQWSKNFFSFSLCHLIHLIFHPQ